MRPLVCDVKEPWSGWLTGPCAMAIQDAEWRRNKERRRRQECASCLPLAWLLPSLPARLVSSMMAPFVLTTTEEKKKGRGREGRGGRRRHRRVAGRRSKEDESSSLPPSLPLDSSSGAGLARVISSQVRVTFVRHYSEQGIEQARSELGEGTLPVFLCELQIEECFGTEILHGSRHINFHFSDCRAD